MGTELGGLLGPWVGAGLVVVASWIATVLLVRYLIRGGPDGGRRDRNW